MTYTRIKNSRVLVTGSAGFIGFHVTKRLLEEGNEVIGIDNINSYYNVNLKYARLAETGIYAPEETDHSGGGKKIYHNIEYNKEIQSVIFPKYRFIRLNLEDNEKILHLFKMKNFDYVINLAAQPGVRYSLENPYAYIQSNIVGFLNILEGCRHYPVKHLVFASSSSIYGENTKVPFSENDLVDHPVSLYAATKKSDELMAYTYSQLFNIPVTGLRYFTVYGPWGRPDMSPILFADAIIKGKPIKVFNNGEMERDFTYIDDIVEGTLRVMNNIISKNILMYNIYNIGNGNPVNLMDFIQIMEKCLGKQTEKNFMPMQSGDVKRTWADISKLREDFHYKPIVDINNGVIMFVKWFKDFNKY